MPPVFKWFENKSVVERIRHNKYFYQTDHLVTVADHHEGVCFSDNEDWSHLLESE